MNENFRRVALIAASLGLVVSLFVALRDDDDAVAPATTAATTGATTATVPEIEPQPTDTGGETAPATTDAPPATTEAPATTAPQGPQRIRLWVENGQPRGGIARPRVNRGDEVVLVVRSDVADHIHLHGYDLIADVGPGRPAQIAFTATVAGRFELELEDRGVQIADLEVRP